jgi:hypothetical protein
MSKITDSDRKENEEFVTRLKQEKEDRLKRLEAIKNKEILKAIERQKESQPSK